MHQHYSTCDTFYVILNNIRLFRAKICSIHLLPSLTHTNDLCRSLFTLFFLCLNHFRCSSIVSYQLLLQKKIIVHFIKHLCDAIRTTHSTMLWTMTTRDFCLFVCLLLLCSNKPTKKIFFCS